VLPLDQLLEKENIEDAFIKIDVEGGELAVVEGLNKSLTTRSLIIGMEYLAGQNNNGTHREAAEALYKARYKSYIINNEGVLVHCPDIPAWLKESGIDSENVIFDLHSHAESLF
jgi:hypothetical protein